MAKEILCGFGVDVDAVAGAVLSVFEGAAA